MSKISMLFCALSCVWLLSSCEYEFIDIGGPPDDGDLPEVSFSAEVAPIFTDSGCTGCHNGGSTSPDLRPQNAFNSLQSLNLVIPGDPDGSKIYTYPHPVTGTHNYRYKSIANANAIYAWIKNGAEDN